jgi:hypothetical protein
MADYNVDDYSGSDFIQKDRVKTDGPLQLRIKNVEQRDGLPKNGKVSPELVLIFSDDSKFGLRARVNRDELRDAFGKMTSGWRGRLIELYHDATVRNPAGQKVGGIRIRIPAQDAGAPLDFRSDLDVEKVDNVEEEQAPF